MGDWWFLQTVVAALVGIIATFIGGWIWLSYTESKDKVKLDTKLVVNEVAEGTRIIVTVVCKSKRPAKIKRVRVSVRIESVTMEKHDGSEPKEFKANALITDLIPITKPNHEQGYVLERDDFCEFYLPSQLPYMQHLIESKSEDLEIIAIMYDNSKVTLMSGPAILKSFGILAKRS